MLRHNKLIDEVIQMRPTICARCKKNPAVIFITKIENGESTNEGLCLKCAKDLNIKPVEDIIRKMGLTDEDLESLTDEMMEAMGGLRAWLR
jgi:ATP-dependent Clp protease ATP-binding subunit ClpB/ATP-dependent Clp protease ATP-binding subunit ClpC